MGNVITWTEHFRNHNTAQRIDVFDVENDELSMYSAFDGMPSWSHQSLKSPTNVPLKSASSATTYLPSDNWQRIQVFAVGQDKQLYVDYNAGPGWRWIPLQNPSGVSLAGAPESIAYVDPTGAHSRTFLLGSDGNLWVNWWDGVDPGRAQWQNLGAPSGTVVEYPPAVATYWNAATGYNIYVYLLGLNSQLYVKWWDGSNWSIWYDLSTPPGATTTRFFGGHGASAWSRTLFFNEFRADVFVQCDHGLYAKVGNDPSPSNWQWQHLNPAPKPPLDELGPRAQSGALLQAVSALFAPPINAFVVGQDSHLYMTYWDGSSWQWEDHGQPSVSGTPSFLFSTSGAVSYLKRAFGDIFLTMIYVVVSDTQHRLYANYFDGVTWQWQNL